MRYMVITMRSLALSGVLLLLGCGGLSSRGTPTPPPNGTPQFGHVFLVVEENHSYSDVIGNSQMPYLNNLASQYSLATQYFANIHPSLGNYFMLTTGLDTPSDDLFNGTVSADNVVRELVKAGKSWKCYAENLPSVGYTGNDLVFYPYVKWHNPFAYFTDVTGTSEANNLVSFDQFKSDLAAGHLPNYSFIVPNMLDDAHDGPLAVADLWLRVNIDPLISNPVFQKDGLLVILFDESDGNDTANGGGHVAAVVVSAQAKKGFQSTTMYQHQSTLRLLLQGLGVTSLPGAAASAPSMGEFF